MSKPQDDFSRLLKKWSRIVIYLVAIYVLVVHPIWNFVLSYFQSEATIGLKYLLLSERGRFQSEGAWTDQLSSLNVRFQSDGRYVYFVSPSDHDGRRLEELGLVMPVDFAAFGAPEPGLKDEGFVAVAIGNIDLDKDLDVWWVDQTGEMRNSKSDVWRFWSFVRELFRRA